MTAKHPFPAAFLLAVSACGPGPEVTGEEVDPLIIGDVDWVDVTRLDPDGAERARTRAVGYLSLPARGTRCTAFIVAPDVLMTNHHCVPAASSARGAIFDPTRETGVAFGQRARYRCETRLGGDADLDFALLRCEGRPGDAFGVLALDPSPPARGLGIYVPQQNCDYYARPGCAPNKVLARGRITRAGSRLSHDADTLGGSSGSPVLSGASHAVVGLHNAGVGNDGRGRGFENRAVPMSRIVPYLQANFPNLQLGATAPDPSVSTQIAPDALEPNDSALAATPIEPTIDELTVHPGDQDVFSVVISERSSISVALTFAHALGDLDAELRQGSLSGPTLATAVSGDDDERFEVAGLEPGTYYLRVYGYQNATNRYVLRATVAADVDRTPPPAPPAEPPAETEPFEPNDDPDQAPVVAVPFIVQEGLRIADGADVDHFAFDADGATRTVRLSFSHAVGDLDLFVLDAEGRTVATSNGVSDEERISMAFAPGRYFVKVAGYASASGPYALRLE